MKITLTLLLSPIIIITIITGCSENQNAYKEGPADLQYLIHYDNPGPTIRVGDFLSVHFIHRTEEDSFLTSSYIFDHPTFFEHREPVFKGDIFDGLAMLSEGDSATFKINFDSAHTMLNIPKPAHTKSNNLYFTVKIEKVIPRGDRSDSLFHLKVERFIKEEILKSMKEEPGKIDKYLSANNLRPEVTASGLNYIVTREGKGDPARKGDSVKFEYTGRLAATGRVFITNNSDTAKKYGYSLEDVERFIPSKILVGSDTIMPGLDEALLLFPKGAQVKLILTSKLAYGENGQHLGLPPHAPLVFDVEILDIQKNK